MSEIVQSVLMSETFQGILLALIPLLLVSIITALLTVRLSMKQFYSQRWWEKKADVYSSLIQSMSYMQYYYGDCQDEITGTKIDDRKTYYDEYHKAEIYLKNMAGMGGYLISKEAAGLLSELLKTIVIDNIHRGPGEEFDDFGRCLRAVSETTEKIKEYAIKDLKGK